MPFNTDPSDKWLQEGGVDPEVNQKNSPAYPHRISLDLDDDTYNRLKTISFERRIPMTQIIRERLSDL